MKTPVFLAATRTFFELYLIVIENYNGIYSEMLYFVRLRYPWKVKGHIVETEGFPRGLQARALSEDKIFSPLCHPSQSYTLYPEIMLIMRNKRLNQEIVSVKKLISINS